MTDYVILGGGTAGCVVASRLKEKHPSCTVILIEAGPNEHEHQWIKGVMGAPNLHQSKFQYNYNTVPQKHYDDRVVYLAGGKALSGSSAVNYAMWSRGCREDYDRWARIANDKKWSYDGMLPYFRKTETHHRDSISAGVDQSQHGFQGPIHTTASIRRYPLHDDMKAALLTTGLEWKNDANSGDPVGIAPYTENWRAGQRQPAGKAYGLKGVEVITSLVVRRILIQNGVAIGAETADGLRFLARKEVILCCGAIRSPQILMLSGIGPQTLERQGIKQLVDLPDVGRNFTDHPAIMLNYRVQRPERSVVALSPGWTDPSYLEGIPVDFVATAKIPETLLRGPMERDSAESIEADREDSAPPYGLMEILPVYGPLPMPLIDMSPPLDGSCLTIGLLDLLPTARGFVELASTDPAADPVIDPNYFSTETDRAVLREGLRIVLRMADTPAGKRIFAEELPPGDMEPLSSASSDADLDARMRRVGHTFHHPSGTCAMGKVVDSNLRVFGVEKLRVVDTSVFPCPIGAHYQVATYALAEQAADIIAEANA